jgi:hypothetical protein
MVLLIETKIDASKLNEGLALAAQFSKRTPAQAANTAAYEVAINAKNTMPFVTAARIDTEMGTVVAARIGVRGKPLSTKNSKNRFLLGERPGTDVERPLATMIVLARMNLAGLPRKAGTGTTSNYNVSTNNRYALPGYSPKGVPRAAWAATIRAFVDSMIKNRRRSGHFLMSGWIPAVRALGPLTKNQWRRGSEGVGPPLEGSNFFYTDADVGSAVPAIEGSTSAACIIMNNIGGEGRNSYSFNKALWEQGALPFQRALDGEGAKAFAYFFMKQEQELARQVNAIWN